MKMKKTILVWLLSLAGLAIVSSCTEDKIISNRPALVNTINVTGQDFTDEETGTRAAYTVDGTGFHFSWTQGDTVGIYPLGGDQVAFPISSGEGSQTAQFDGGAWALRSTYSYAAYYPFSSDNYKNKETSIPITYLGQVQNGNGSLDCLDRYDYQASIATKPDANGNVNIALKHLGCFVRFQLTMPVADTYSSIELKSTGTPFVTSGYVDLSSDSIHITPTSTSKTIKIDLNNTSTTTQDSVLVVYAMLAPTDLSGKNINVIVTGSDDNKYVSFFTGKNMLAGKAYSYKSGLTDGATVTEDGDIVPPDNEIWYITNDNTIIDLEASYSLYNSQPFDADVISHTYENGKGIIRCDGPIIVINEHVFGNRAFPNITNIYLPNSITTIETGALRNLSIKEIRLPDNLIHVGSYALNIPTLERFYGNNCTEDGRCVVLKKEFSWNGFDKFTLNAIEAFAPSGLTEYSTPKEVEVIDVYAFAWCPDLRHISFNEGLKGIMRDAFVDDILDCDITFPESLEYLSGYVFRACYGIKGFYGNSKFHSKDHLCQYSFDPFLNYKQLERFVGEDLIEYTIEEDVQAIQNYAFDNLNSLESITVPASIAMVGIQAFSNCPNIKEVRGSGATSDHRSIMTDGVFHKLVVSSNLKQYSIPQGTKIIAYGALQGCSEIEEVSMTDEVEMLGGYAFEGCYNLKKVTLSSHLKKIGYNQGPIVMPANNPFNNAQNLEEIYFRSPNPPEYSDTQFDVNPNLKVYVPKESLGLYKKSGWFQYAPYMLGYDYEGLGYISSDYSADSTASTLQQSSSGAGIDLILLGDGFSDRQIADGTYTNVMQNAMNAFFAEEPYKSFKDYFNVYSVNVVSLTEGYEHSGQALGTGHGDATYVYGNDAKVIEYAKKAISEDKLDDAVIIVMMNEDAYAGTCYMYDPVDGDYGRGTAIAYFPTNSITENFNGLVLHEAGGHGFAKLADEYAYEYNGTITQEAIDANKVNEPYGWWKNVDFTSDPTKVKWSTFISDSRYANENIGCYEGGLTYWSGVWRPTEESIMRYNTGGFNAPSRYAIWYRINKLAYGDSWNGTYEDFVEYDAINRTPSAVSRRTQSRRNYVEKPLPQLAPPVVVGHSWREAK